MQNDQSQTKSAAAVASSDLFGGVKRWIRPKTEADRWRAIEINLKLFILNVSLSIVFVVAVIIMRLMRYQ